MSISTSTTTLTLSNQIKPLTINNFYSTTGLSNLTPFSTTISLPTTYSTATSTFSNNSGMSAKLNTLKHGYKGTYTAKITYIISDTH